MRPDEIRMEDVRAVADRIVVLARGRTLMSGAPREVFSRGGELTRAGLDVPQATRIAMALQKRGLPVDPAVYTVEELADALLALKKGGAV